MSSTHASNAQASERAFVGAVINGDTRATDHGLRLADFTDSFCRSAFSACLQLEAQGKQADLATLYDTFPNIDSTKLITLTHEASVVGSLVHQHAANIRGAGQRRKIVDLFLKAAQAAQDPANPLEEVITKTSDYLNKSTAQMTPNNLTSGTDALVEFALWLENPGIDPPISTGLAFLDTKLNGGLLGGNLYVIGARTSVGKSALMCFIATNAIKNGLRVLYVSLEMSNRKNISRMIASISGVSLSRINNSSTLSDGDHLAICEAYKCLKGDNFHFLTNTYTPASIRRDALRVRAQTGIDLLVVDYLQFIRPDEKQATRDLEIGACTKALKNLAEELKIPVLTASQLNRASAQGGAAPRLVDLRESGSIEQDADVVILMHRPDGQEKESIKRIEILVAKQRDGSLGASILMFDGSLMRFYPPKH